MGAPPDAVRLVDKAAGQTSHDVVARTRRELRDAGHGKVRVGHAGTLDPFATGLLLVLIGRATRAQRWFMHADKTYETTVRFGWRSSTGDPEGELTETGRVPPEPLALPTGRIRQRPPAYSAIKLGGERAYAKARRGETVEMPEREVVVHAFERTGPDAFRIRCSSGTYVRSLVADLGDAYCLTLRRTAIGPFDVRDAGTEVPLGEALARVLPVVHVDGHAARDAIHGRPVTVGEPVGGEVAVFDEDGLISIAAPRRDAPATVLRTVVGFRAS